MNRAEAGVFPNIRAGARAQLVDTHPYGCGPVVRKRAAVTNRAGRKFLAPPSAKRRSGLPIHQLTSELGRAERMVADLRGRADPDDGHSLFDFYHTLGTAMATAEAVLRNTADALSPDVGGGVARPAIGYRHLRQRAFATLRAGGEQFARMDPIWTAVVHKGGGWGPQSVEAQADRGDGRPLYHYRNTFKTAGTLTESDKRQRFQKYADRFTSAGGAFSDMLTAEPGFIDSLKTGVAYDYSMLPDGTTRLWDRSSKADAGHLLLAAGSADYADPEVLYAGEMRALRDSDGGLVALVVGTGSGHYLPNMLDATNTLPHLDRLGVPRDRIVFVGGPNDLPAMFAELEEKLGIAGAGARVPATADQLLARWSRPASMRPHQRFA